MKEPTPCFICDHLRFQTYFWWVHQESTTILTCLITASQVLSPPYLTVSVAQLVLFEAVYFWTKYFLQGTLVTFFLRSVPVQRTQDHSSLSQEEPSKRAPLDPVHGRALCKQRLPPASCPRLLELPWLKAHRLNRNLLTHKCMELLT